MEWRRWQRKSPTVKENNKMMACELYFIVVYTIIYMTGTHAYHILYT